MTQFQATLQSWLRKQATLCRQITCHHPVDPAQSYWRRMIQSQAAMWSPLYFLPLQHIEVFIICTTGCKLDATTFSLNQVFRHCRKLHQDILSQSWNFQHLAWAACHVLYKCFKLLRFFKQQLHFYDSSLQSFALWRLTYDIILYLCPVQVHADDGTGVYVPIFLAGVNIGWRSIGGIELLVWPNFNVPADRLRLEVTFKAVNFQLSNFQNICKAICHNNRAMKRLRLPSTSKQSTWRCDQMLRGKVLRSPLVQTSPVDILPHSMHISVPFNAEWRHCSVGYSNDSSGTGRHVATAVVMLKNGIKDMKQKPPFHNISCSRHVSCSCRQVHSRLIKAYRTVVQHCSVYVVVTRDSCDLDGMGTFV